MCQQCLEEVARIQASWRDMGITDEEAMRRTVEEELLPVINKKQKALENVLEKMDKNLDIWHLLNKKMDENEDISHFTE